MSQQLAEWTGDFGRAYLERNQVDPATRVDWFRRTLRPLRLTSVCEIGANKGHNLLALECALGQSLVTFGIEPSLDARAAARGMVAIRDGDIYDIPFVDAAFDLAMTSGVLIHIPPEGLDTALREMHRVAKRYLLAIEYHRDQDTEIPYRDMAGMMWGRDYGAHYLRLFPELALLATGDLTLEEHGFDNARYWLLEKGEG